MRTPWNGIHATRGLKLGLGVFGLTVLGGGACERPTAPEPGENVRIVLGVSGGFAGVDWQLTIDGGRAKIVGDRCRRRLDCDWSAGEVLAATDGPQLLELAQRFVDARFLELPRTDYGTECCDQLGYRLTYGDGDDQKTVLGSDGTLPSSLLDLVREVRRFVNAARGGA